MCEVFYNYICGQEHLSTDNAGNDNTNANNNDDTRQTIHDYIDPLAFMPNEPTSLLTL